MANNKLTLAITTVGDLLLHSKITRQEDGKSIENVQLSVPDYQRPYKWDAKNAIQLLDDIIEAKSNNKEVYRVGTLILYKNNSTYEIVDGQQRTITFSLLLKALGEDKIPLLDQDVPDNPFNRRNIPKNYNAFRRRLEMKTKNDSEKKREQDDLREYIEERCEMIVVITDDISEAFQFFDSQNARGKSLYPHDLLKAYHLREMSDVGEQETEKIVKDWEDNDQKFLARLFGNYLYRIKEWINGNRAERLNETTIYKFKGVTKSDRTPFAQYYKSAYAYADMVNNSFMPFVSGSRKLNAFQIDAPIVAGKPFFEYAKHYLTILKDIQDNDKYEGFYINGNEIVKTLDTYYKRGTGNNITRLLFDTSVLLYVDRFCPETYPDKNDLDMFERFVVYAFIWAYSLRAQYQNLGWLSAQNYILGKANIVNSFNIYKTIKATDSPATLLSILANKISPLSLQKVSFKRVKTDNIDKFGNNVYENFLHYFKEYNFYTAE